MKCFILWICVITAFCGLAAASSDEGEDTRQDAKKRVYQLEDITVTPGLFSLSERVTSPFLISNTEIEKLPLIDNDIYRAAHNLPGVVADDFSARFSLRGGDRDETVIRLDGMELYDPFHLQDFGGAISVIDMGILRDADLLTGGFPAEYGDAMSGVFDVTSREGHSERVSGNAGIDMLNTHLILDGPSWMLAARRGYIDLLMGLFDTEEVFEPRYYDLYGKVDYDMSAADRFSANILYAGDSNEIDRKDDENDLTSRYWNGLLWAKWHHLAGEKTLWDLYLFSGHAGREKYEGIDGVDERQFSYVGLKGDLTYNHGPSQVLKAGWRLQGAEADYNYFLREEQIVTAVDAQPTDWSSNGYVQDEWRIAGWLAGNLGLRYIYQDYGDHFALMPRAALAAKLRRYLTVRGAWGVYAQPVQITSLPVEEGIADSQPPEKAVHYVLAAEYSPSASLRLRTEAYYKTFNDLAGRIKDYGRKEQLFTSPESGSARGIEIYFRHAPARAFTWGLGYAMAKSDMETETGEIPRDFDRRHALSLSADYSIWNDGSLNVVWRYHTGDPYTEAWYERAASEDGNSSVWQKSYGPVNDKRYPAYHSLDVRLTKYFQFRSWKLSFYFQILNSYNRKNVHEYSFERVTDDKGEISYRRITEHLLPILPTLGLNAQF